MYSLEIPKQKKMYPPLLGDRWGDGEVVGYAKSKGRTYWVKVKFPNGEVAKLEGVPVNYHLLVLGA